MGREKMGTSHSAKSARGLLTYLVRSTDNIRAQLVTGRFSETQQKGNQKRLRDFD